MNIDYNAVIEIFKKFLDNEKIEILGISVGEERQVREAIKNLLTAYEKEKEKNKTLEELNKSDESKEQSSMKYYNLYKELVDKIKEILGIEEKIDNEKLLSLLQTIVDENARLEDIEDRKVQIEYNNVFNKGVKSVEDKIKAKIEEVEQWELYNMKIPRLSTLDERLGAKIGIKYVLQSLLEKE